MPAADRAAVLAAAAMLAAACGGSEAGPGGQGREAALSCGTPSLARDSAAPLDSVAVRGVEPGPDPVFGLVRPPRDSLEGYAAVDRRPDGRLLLRVPVHPEGRLEGGDVEVVLTDGRARCSPLRLTLLPLEPAPGASKAVVEAVQAHVATMAAHFGTTPEALLGARADTLAPPLVALLVAQTLLDHPGNPVSARALVAEYAEGSEQAPGPDPRLLDALLGRAGLAGRLEELNRESRRLLERRGPVEPLRPAAVPGPDAGSPSARGGRPRRGGFGARRPPAGRAGTGLRPMLASRPVASRPVAPPRPALGAPAPPAAPRAGGPAPQEGGPGVDVCASVPDPRPDVETLDAWMELATLSELATTGKPKRTLALFNLVLGAGTALATAARTQPGARKLAKFYAGTAGLAFAYQSAAEAAAHLLPSELVRLDFELGKPVFREDDAEWGWWEGPRVVARSRGWSFDKLTLSALAQIANLKAAGGLDPLVTKYMPGAKLGELLDQLSAFTVGNVLNDIISEASRGSELLRCPPMDFGPTELTEEKWYTVDYVGEAVMPTSSLPKFYEPREVGTTTLTVSTAPKRFGHREPAVRSRHIRVAAIQVEWEPERKRAAPGDTVRFMVAVENAVDKRLEFEADAGRIVGKENYGDAPDAEVGYWRVTYRTPPRRRDFPASLRAASVADRSHLRTAPERWGKARVVTERLRVVPAGRCVTPGDTLRFTALLDGRPTSRVRWRARRGSVGADGTYRAPRRAGEDTVTATLRRDSDVRAHAVAAVRRCSWTMTVLAGPRRGFYWGRAASLRRTETAGDAGGGSGRILLTGTESVFGLTDRVRVTVSLGRVPPGETGAFESGAANATRVVFNDAAASADGREVVEGFLEAAGPLASEPFASYWTADAAARDLSVETADGPLPLDRIHTLRGSFPVPDPARLEITHNGKDRVAGSVRGDFLTLAAGHVAGPMAGDSAAFRTVPIEIEFDAEVGAMERRLRRVREKLLGDGEGGER